MHQSPLKHMRLHYIDCFLSEIFKEAKLDKKALTKIFEMIGGDRQKIANFMRSIIPVNEALLIDLTHVFSFSDNMLLAEKGYNSDFDFEPQVNILLMISSTKRIPLFYRLLPGSVRDVRSLKATIQESQIEDVIIIADKGFYSRENVDLLNGEGLRYILPLKRNSSLIDYSVLRRGLKEGFEGFFKFQRRHIWYYGRSEGGFKIWTFLDEDLRIKEQEDYLTRVETHPEDYSVKEFHKINHTFGSISLMTNLRGLSARRIFEYFKSRVYIENMFDTFKNVLDADRTYMRNDRAMECWMFVNFLALIFYYKVYQLLVEQDLLGQFSPLDVLLYLSKIRKVKVGDGWIDLEVPKQVKNLLEKLKLPIT